VDDIKTARDAVIEARGKTIGKTVSLEVSGAGKVTFVYLTDPEGNIIELQH
jgi:catechol-2,3-dioxygenase